jgi:hypothetical protein
MTSGMLIMFTKFLISSSTLLMSGCAGHYRASEDAHENCYVIPRDGGDYDVVSRWKDQGLAERGLWRLPERRVPNAVRNS